MAKMALVNFEKQSGEVQMVGSAMRVSMVCLLIFAGIAVANAQDTTPSAHQPAAASSAPENSVGTTSVRRSPGVIPRSPLATATPVLTVDGPCTGSETKSASKNCKAVVTAADIDAVANVLNADNSAMARRQFAVNYTRLFAAANAAQKKDIDKLPEVLKEIEVQQQLVRIEILAKALYRQLEVKAKDIPTAVLEKYYQEHQPQFEIADLQRIYVPKSLGTSAAEIADNVALKTWVQELRARAVAGEDIDKLQREAFSNLNIKAPAPNTKLREIRRTKLPVSEATAFDMKPGEVTEVLDTPGAYAILKLDSKMVMPIENAKTEISKELQRAQMMQEILETTNGVNAEFNLSYLNLPSAPQLFPPPELTALATQATQQNQLGRQVSMRPPTAPRSTGAKTPRRARR